jgi:putative redox protein
MKPSELLLSALGSCAGYDVVSILGKRKKTLRNLRVDVTAEQADEGWPRPYTAFHMHFVVDADVTPEEVEKAIHLSEEKYCSVAATLRPAKITWDYEIVGQEVPANGD